MESQNHSPQEEEINEEQNLAAPPALEPQPEVMVDGEEMQTTAGKAVAQEQLRKRKKGLLIGTAVAGVLVIAAIIVGLLLPDLFANRGPVLVTVANEKIYVADYQERVRYYRWQFLQQFAQISQILEMFGDYDGQQQAQLNQITMLLGDHAYFGDLVLNSMIDEVILVKNAEDMGITVTDEEVMTAIQEAFGYRPDADAEIEDGLNADPETQPTPYTKEQFDEDYAEYIDRLSVAGVSEEEFLEVQWISLLFNALYEEVTKDYVAGTVEQVQARHILVEDLETAQTILDQLNAEESTFEELAAEYSLDTYSAQNGGELGWFARGMMIPTFEEAAFSLEIGEVSEPIETDYGYHIIQVTGREDQPISAEEAAAEQQAQFSEWLNTQNAVMESSIVIDEELLAESIPTQPDLNDPLVFEALFGGLEEDTEE